MILGCPNCGARFRVAADELGPSGRRLVRCARCRHEWTATVNDLAPEPPAGAAKPRRAGAKAAKPKPAPLTKPAAPPPPPPAAKEPEPPVPAPEPPPELPSALTFEPPPTTEAAEDARLHAEAATSPFEEMLAKAVAPTHKPSPSRLKGLDVKRLGAVAGWVLLFVVVAGLAAAAIERTPVMNAFPGTKPVYAFLGFDIPPPGDGLRLTNVNSTRGTEDGVPTLVIEGKVTNTTDGPRAVPAMRGSLRDAKDQELQSWVFNADTAKLAAGESASFKTEVKQPSPRATGLSISFTAETK